jgi:hypothetical protein
LTIAPQIKENAVLFLGQILPLLYHSDQGLDTGTAALLRNGSDMTKRPQPTKAPRVATRVNSHLENKLVAYVTAASATGLALSLASASAEAKIVYTATKTSVTYGTTLDLNGDGIPDFAFDFPSGPSFHSSALVVRPLEIPNGIRCQPSAGSHGGCFNAVAGKYGMVVGPDKQFATNTFYGYGVQMADFIAYNGKTYFDGPWANVKNRYLGLKFLVGNDIHYGWARLSVGNWNNGGKVVLTGYAYETKANTKILAGHTSGPEEADADSARIDPAQPPVLLGLLARGADGLAIWRRDDD